jgi:hypothetical protein
MTVFIMDAETEQRLLALADYAEENRIPLDEMKSRAEDYERGIIRELGSEHNLELPMGFKVVFTIEEHPLRDGSGTMWLRHMSMSSPRVGRVPVRPAVEWVMRVLGYISEFEECMIYPEDFGPDRVAINVLEEMPPVRALMN